MCLRYDGLIEQIADLGNARHSIAENAVDRRYSHAQVIVDLFHRCRWTRSNWWRPLEQILVAQPNPLTRSNLVRIGLSISVYKRAKQHMDGRRAAAQLVVIKKVLVAKPNDAAIMMIFDLYHDGIPLSDRPDRSSNALPSNEQMPLLQLFPLHAM